MSAKRVAIKKPKVPGRLAACPSITYYPGAASGNCTFSGKGDCCGKAPRIRSA